jgi:hypothetical protein
MVSASSWSAVVVSSIFSTRARPVSGDEATRLRGARAIRSLDLRHDPVGRFRVRQFPSFPEGLCPVRGLIGSERRLQLAQTRNRDTEFRRDVLHRPTGKKRCHCPPLERWFERAAAAQACIIPLPRTPTRMADCSSATAGQSSRATSFARF